MADELTPNERTMLEAWQPHEAPAGFTDRVMSARAMQKRLVVAAIAASVVASAAIGFVVVQTTRDKAKVVGVVPSTDAAAPAVARVEPVDAGAIVLMDGPAPMTVPADVDLVFEIGGNVTIHDPSGTPNVRFAFGSKCTGEGELELARGTVRLGKTGVNAVDRKLEPGISRYAVRCGGSDAQAVLVARGFVTVRADAATRPLPRTPPVNPIAADGRTYRISYQSVIPDVIVDIRGPGKLHLATGGKEDTFETTGKQVHVSGSKLAEATYKYWVDADPTKISTLIIAFDQTAPQVYIEHKDFVTPDKIVVQGGTLPGWTLHIDDIDVPIDNLGRFHAIVPRPDRVLVMRFDHPKWGAHYYLRRGF
jgi:hypothetical protein